VQNSGFEIMNARISGGRIMAGKSTSRWARVIVRSALFAGIVLASGNGDAIAQAVLDICGCAGDPTLTDFDASNPATYPPGTTGCSSTCTAGTITFTLPPDGVLKFKSFRAVGGFYIRFVANPANPPVTILVAGDIELRGSNCCYNLDVSGGSGSHGVNGVAGIGGMGGPGGFRGGDGASEPVNLAAVGGAGSGPGGGIGATQADISTGGTFIGVPELLPLVGGSGGGGGTGWGTTMSCTGGGGGGGGGGLLIAANGTLTVVNYDMYAIGGDGGSVGNAGCARGGSGGAGGAIRLAANRFATSTTRLFAYGGSVAFTGNAGTPGRIRLESVDISSQSAFSPNPLALRVTGPSPVSNAVSPSVSITHINGTPVPVPPQGFRGSIDLTLPAPGVTSVDVTTSGVPSGTTVEIKVKPRIGAAPQTALVPLAAGSCDAQGNCTATTTFNLTAGAYLVEARATFQVQ
jgi:hypothetical protein